MKPDPIDDGAPTRLALTGVTAGYGSTTVLRDVSLRVQERSAVALLGANGAGKTTLLRAASGLIRPTSGDVRLDGVDVAHRPVHRRASAGLCHVPEGRGVFPNLSVEDNLVLHVDRSSAGPAFDRAFDAFPRLGERRRQKAGSLSGGEQKMLALARAYVAKPGIILLDEASLGLAPQVVDTIFAFLHRLTAEGVAILLVEQYVTKALAIADHVYVLNRGRITFDGRPSELQDDDILRDYLGADAAPVAP